MPRFSALARNMAKIQAAGALIVIEVETRSERDAGEEPLHVGQGVHGDAGLADLPGRQCVVGVPAVEGRVVEGDGEAGLALFEEEPVAALVWSAVPMPANWRMVQSLPRYIVGWTPRVKGYSPGRPSRVRGRVPARSSGV